MSERSLPPQVLTEIDSPIREIRLAGVDDLARLVCGADLAIAAAARLALTRMTDDDSRSVAAAANAALELTSVRLNPDRVDFGLVPPETQRLSAEVVADGPPLAVANAMVTVSGPGLRAALVGRRLHIVWQPRSDWLDGSVMVRGPAGWSDVRVTGQVDTTGPMSRAVVEEQLQADDHVGFGVARVTVLATRPARRNVGATVLIGALTALVLLGGAGVAVAWTTSEGRAPQTVAGPALPAATTPNPPLTRASDASPRPRSTTTFPRIPLARRVASFDKPTVVGTIRVGAEPEGVVVSPDGRTLYVANQNSRVLSVVDAASRRVTSVGLRNTPRFVAVSRDGKLVFVSMYEDDKKTGSGVAVVDTATRKVVRYVTTGAQPFTLAVGPDGRIWVPIHSQGRVEVYAGANQRADGRIEVPPNPHSVAFSAGLMRAFTANHEANAVAVIDMSTDRLLKSIPVSKSPHSIATSPDGKTVLVAGYDANTVDLIDAKTLRSTGPFRVGKQPQSVAFATDGGHAYVVNEGGNSVSVLNGRTGTVTATVRVGGSPRAIAVSPDGRLAYVTNGTDNTVSVLRVGE